MELFIVYFSEQSIKYQMRIKRTLPLSNSYDDISKISILIFYLWLNFPSLMIFQIIPAVLLIHTLRHYGTVTLLLGIECSKVNYLFLLIVLK